MGVNPTKLQKDVSSVLFGDISNSHIHDAISFMVDNGDHFVFTDNEYDSFGDSEVQMNLLFHSLNSIGDKLSVRKNKCAVEAGRQDLQSLDSFCLGKYELINKELEIQDSNQAHPTVIIKNRHIEDSIIVNRAVADKNKNYITIHLKQDRPTKYNL